MTPTLSLVEVSELLTRFRYKPGYVFRAVPPASVYDQVDIEVGYYTQDSYGKGRLDVQTDIDYDRIGYLTDRMFQTARRQSAIVELIPIYGKFPMPPYVISEAGFWDWMHKSLIRQIEQHEIDEWFRVDGQVVHDPHAPRHAMT